MAGLAIMIGSGYVMVRRHRNDKA
ncbi:LPXTG cell wall anchor domain-containing protein [Streptococcus equi]